MTSDDSPAPASEREVWSLSRKIALRAAVIYFGLSFIPEFFAIDLLLDPLRALVAGRFWGLSELPSGEDTGSGDRLIDHVTLVMNILCAVGGTVIWSLLDRKRPNYRWGYEALRVLLRYSLALTLMSYGFSKLYQFPPISHATMARPFGSETPMGVLWNFMGSSPAYTAISGVLEVLGGLLLLFRRTATLSALVVVPVMLNVFLLNLCYDVPVKLMSFHLLLAAVVLTLPDVRRLIDVLVFNRATVPRELTPPLRYPYLRIGVLVMKWLLFAGTLRNGMDQALTQLKEFQAPRSALAGIWIVESFRQAGKEIEAVDLRKPLRWDLAIFDQTRSSNLRVSVDQIGGEQLIGTASWPQKDSLQLRFKGKPAQDWVCALNGDSLELRGRLQGAPTEITLRRAVEEYPLMRHQIHWIQERPRTP
ncbi:hypothetical protein EON81_03750 [bacterium]|nr:MAG: hypothetical protein EON81_03750 [bacterium]